MYAGRGYSVSDVCMYVCNSLCLCVCVCLYVCVRVCVCVCVQISSLKPLGQLKPNFMWNLHGIHGIAEESLFKWSRSFVVLHYCQPPGVGGGCGERGLLAGILP